MGVHANSKPQVSILKKGRWTPPSLSIEMLHKVQAEIGRLLQMRSELSDGANTTESSTILVSGTVVQGGDRPNMHRLFELEKKIKYMHAICDVLSKMPRAKSFNAVIPFLHYLRHMARKLPIATPPDGEPSIFDNDFDGKVLRHNTETKCVFYNPPVELRDAAREFLRVHPVKIAGNSEHLQRVVGINDCTALVNLTSADVVKPAFGAPAQLISAVGTPETLPPCAVMMRDGERLGLYQRVDEPFAIKLLKHQGTYAPMCTYKAW